MNTYEKLESLKNFLEEMGSVMVALSGGVDSTFLLKVASDTLGNRCTASTIVSNIYPSWEMDEAAEIANKLGVEYVTIPCDPVKDIKGFSRNPVDRCYICKKAVFSIIKEYAESMGIGYVLDGTNADDMEDYRPGFKAVKELGIQSPLLMAGLTKQEIRELSREMGLRIYNKPSVACLATRIPYNEEINDKKLKMIDMAESYILSKGVRNVRVRCHGDLARIETGREDIERFLDNGFRSDIDTRLKSYGFKYVSLDLFGYKTGSMNIEVKNG